MIFRKQKKIDLVFWVFGSIAFFVIISLSVIMYLLFNKYRANNIGSNVNRIQETSIQPELSPEELKNNYVTEVKNLLTFVQNSNVEISGLAKDLENKMLEVRVPMEEREKFLSATLQIVRMQKQGLQVDANASKDKILEILNSLF